MLDWNHLEREVEIKHRIKFSGYKNDTGVYLDFWQEIINTHEINNPCTIRIDFSKIILHTYKTDWGEGYPLLINALGKEDADKFKYDVDKQVDAKNDSEWKLDIIEKIADTFPDEFDKNTMSIEVYIEW